MLRMAKYSHDPDLWLHRARQVAQFLVERMEPCYKELDRVDFHLGDGVGGALSFLIDVQSPLNFEESGFPVFE